MSRMQSAHRSLLVLVFAVVMTSCSSRAEREHGRLPMSDVAVENRHDTIVRGMLRFGDEMTVAGGMLAKGDDGEHGSLSGRIPEKASIDLDVFSGTSLDAPGKLVKHVHSEVDVRKQVPPDLFDAAFYFIIEQDFSLRLVVMSVEDYLAMKARHDRPR